ncbi:MAG: NYN domain-containing protein [Fidelibacterota bacterium]
MLFVDGENFTIRAEKVAQAKGLDLKEGSFYMRDTFIWLPGITGTEARTPGHLALQKNATRSFYYTSLAGDDTAINEVKRKLWDLRFNPQVFKKKKKNEKAKGVDITLSKDLLINAFFNNYDVAVLIAGDGDYVPLVEEIKRLGKVVYLSFFEKEGLNQELRLAADSYFEMEPFFVDRWTEVTMGRIPP